MSEIATKQMCDKVYVTGFCTRSPRKFGKQNPLTFWNMFKDDLSVEFRNIQTRYFAPIMCTAWPRNSLCVSIQFQFMFQASSTICFASVRLYVSTQWNLEFCLVAH